MDSGKWSLAAWLLRLWYCWLAPAFLLAMAGFEAFDYARSRIEDAEGNDGDEEDDDRAD